MIAKRLISVRLHFFEKKTCLIIERHDVDNWKFLEHEVEPPCHINLGQTQVVRVKWTHKKNGGYLVVLSQASMREGLNNFVDPPSWGVLANQMPSVIILIITRSCPNPLAREGHNNHNISLLSWNALANQITPVYDSDCHELVPEPLSMTAS